MLYRLFVSTLLSSGEGLLPSVSDARLVLLNAAPWFQNFFSFISSTALRMTDACEKDDDDKRLPEKFEETGRIQPKKPVPNTEGSSQFLHILPIHICLGVEESLNLLLLDSGRDFNYIFRIHEMSPHSVHRIIDYLSTNVQAFKNRNHIQQIRFI